MTEGYRSLASKIMNLSYEYKLAHEVSVLHRMLRFSQDTAGIYLQEFVRSLE
jgi:hypothetical protein